MDSSWREAAMVDVIIAVVLILGLMFALSFLGVLMYAWMLWLIKIVAKWGILDD